MESEASDLVVKFDSSGVKAETPFARDICLGNACLDHKIPEFEGWIDKTSEECGKIMNRDGLIAFEKQIG